MLRGPRLTPHSPWIAAPPNLGSPYRFGSPKLRTFCDGLTFRSQGSLLTYLITGAFISKLCALFRFSSIFFFKASSCGLLLVSSTHTDLVCEEIRGPVSSPQHLTLAQGQICPTHLVTHFSPWEGFLFAYHVNSPNVKAQRLLAGFWSYMVVCTSIYLCT